MSMDLQQLRACLLEQPQTALEKIGIKIGHAVIDLILFLQERLQMRKEFLPHVWRIAKHHVEAALLKDFGKRGVPAEGARPRLH